MYILLLFSAGKRRPTSPSTKPQQRCSAGLSGRVKWCHYDRLWPEGHIWSGLPHHCHGPRKLQGQNLRPVWKFQQWCSRWVPAARWKRNQELADVRRGVESARPRSGLWRRMQRWPLPQMWHFWKSCVGGEMCSYHQSQRAVCRLPRCHRSQLLLPRLCLRYLHGWRWSRHAVSQHCCIYVRLPRLWCKGPKLEKSFFLPWVFIFL